MTILIRSISRQMTLFQSCKELRFQNLCMCIPAHPCGQDLRRLNRTWGVRAWGGGVPQGARKIEQQLGQGEFKFYGDHETWQIWYIGFLLSPSLMQTYQW